MLIQLKIHEENQYNEQRLKKKKETGYEQTVLAHLRSEMDQILGKLHFM